MIANCRYLPKTLSAAAMVLLCLGSVPAEIHAEIIFKPGPGSALEMPLQQETNVVSEGIEASATPAQSNISKPVRETSRTRQLILNLSRLAAEGDADASLRLGWLYYEGEETTRSYAEAYRHFREAADRGSMAGMLGAGYLLAFGYGASRDPGSAKAFLLRAQREGYARASYLLSLLEGSATTVQARMRAEQYLNQAAARGDPVAANVLGNSYMRNSQTATAKLWYERAMDLGSKAAGRNIELIAQVDGQLKRGKEALEQLRKDSAAGRADASYELAVRYHRGIGVQVDFGQALRYYRLASNQGSVPADQMLTMILSRSSPSQPINVEWMQELSRTMRTPALKIEGIGAISSLDEDDPLFGLLALDTAQNSSAK